MLYFSLLLSSLISVVASCGSLDSTPSIARTPGGDSPPQNQLPPIPQAELSQCGHNMYYHAADVPGAGIVGGINAAPNEYPWLVRLKISIGNDQSDLCGASLISDDWLVTAAHCVVGTKVEDVVAIFADHDKTKPDDGEYARSISVIRVHNQYNRNSNENDIAMLKLSTPVDRTRDWKTQAICLQESCTGGCGAGTTTYIAGWGTKKEDSTSASNLLQKAYVKIQTQSSCKNNYALADVTITDKMVCAGWPNGGVDSCLGDSGGPLMAVEDGYYKLCGITSFGIGCARVGYYGVYTQVCHYIDWIDNNIANF